MDRFTECRALADPELLAKTQTLASADLVSEVDLLVHIGEVDSRGLAEKEGFPSLFQYCVQKLRIGEAIAYWRIQAARSARDFPEILDHIESGALNVTTAKLIAPYLTRTSAREIIDRALGKTRKEVETLIAALQPSAPRRDVVTKCGPMLMARAQWPQTPPAAPAAADTKSLDIVEAVDAERRRLHFDVGPDTAELIERAREILRHKFPFATLEDIVREALNLLLEAKDLDRDDGPETAARPSAEGTRDIPLWVRRAVWRRDGGCCAFVGDGGKICASRSWLEFDHVLPFAQGGRSDDPQNVRLLCRAHNRLAADRAFA